MSAKWKFFSIVIFSIFATAVTVVYLSQRQPSTANSFVNNRPQQVSATDPAEILENQQRANYKPIPLESLNSSLQGRDPADLALNAFDDNTESTKVARKVEVDYPQPEEALVTITQTKQSKHSLHAIKYRVELTTFGRSLLVNSPRMWRIVWAGSQMQCSPGSSPNKTSKQSCHEPLFISR